MANLPRPLIGLLVATVAFFAVWTVALKPSSSGGPVSASKSPSPAPAASASPAPSQTKPATATHAATTTRAVTATHAAAASHAIAAKPKPVAKPAVKHTVSAQQRQSVIANGLDAHKVVAVLFYNPAAADDQAVKHELAEIPTRGGKVVTLAVPLAELTRYPVISNQVQVTESPTLVLIDRQRKADMLTGFLDQFELAQRVSDALAVKK